jgi:hypothetical protein
VNHWREDGSPGLGGNDNRSYLTGRMEKGRNR